MSDRILRLPRLLEADPRGSQLLLNLRSLGRPLWKGSELDIPWTGLNRELAGALKQASGAGQVVRGLEKAEQILAAEERGLRLVDNQTGVTRGIRISRLLLVSSDGAERFYRRVEALLRRHGPRVMVVGLETDAKGLGGILFGSGGFARLIMLKHKEAVASVLLAMAGECNSRS